MDRLSILFGGYVSYRIHGTGMFTYVWLKFLANVSKSSLHGSYGVLKKHTQLWGVRFQKTPGKRYESTR